MKRHRIGAHDYTQATQASQSDKHQYTRALSWHLRRARLDALLPGRMALLTRQCGMGPNNTATLRPAREPVDDYFESPWVEREPAVAGLNLNCLDVRP